MKINGTQLRKIAKAAGATPETLGGAIAERGFDADVASSAVANWMADRNHPRATPGQVSRLAGALGCRPADFCRFVSTARFVRGSERKSRLVADMIRGMPVDQAMSALSFTPKRAATPLKKTLLAAVADAEQMDADVGRLIVAESRVDAGPQMKRFQPKDRGRAHQILKRMSHFIVGVEERK